MTVRVNKDSFNLREKLSELDYGHVPYDKMPAGSVIRTEYKQFDTRLQINHNNSMAFYDFSDLNITISPFSSSSKFLMQANVVSSEDTNPNGGPAFRYEYGGNIYYGNGDYSYTTGMQSKSFAEVDDLNIVARNASAPHMTKTYHGAALVKPNTTDTITFKLGFHGLATFNVNRNNNTATGANYGSGFTTLTVMEIAG
jgi:hypothetical protein